VIFLTFVGSVAAAIHNPVWTGAGPLAARSKHCLCRFLYEEYKVEDVLLQNLKIKDSVLNTVRLERGSSCLSSCEGALRESRVICSVYKNENNAWDLAESQPTLTDRQKERCDNWLPTNQPLANWEASYRRAGATPNKRINFFWWGKLKNNSAKKYLDAAFLPNDIAELLKGQGFEIYYYHQFDDDSESAFRSIHDGGKMHPDIIQRTIGAGGDFAEPGDLLEGTRLEALDRNINNFVEVMETYGSITYAAIKDLLVMCVLLRTGGYFFDTNVKLTDPHMTGAELANMLSTYAEELHIPVYPDLNGNKHRAFVGIFPSDEEDMKALYIFKMEYNAAYSPAGHLFHESAIGAYIHYAHQIKMDTPENALTSTSHQKFLDKDPEYKTTIGSMIRAAVASGMYAVVHSNRPVIVNDFILDVTIDEDLGELTFIEWGLTKMYGGTCREAAVAKLAELEADLDKLFQLSAH